MNMETFVNIHDCRPYQISNKGRVRNSDTNRIMKLQFDYNTDKNGDRKPWRVRVVLRVGGRMMTFSVHRLVGLAFVERLDPNQHTIDHEDRNPFNNNVDNLKWATTKEQMKNRSITKVNRKLTMNDIESMYIDSKTLTLSEMEVIYSIDRSTIHKLLVHMHPDY